MFKGPEKATASSCRLRTDGFLINKQRVARYFRKEPFSIRSYIGRRKDKLLFSYSLGGSFNGWRAIRKAATVARIEFKRRLNLELKEPPHHAQPESFLLYVLKPAINVKVFSLYCTNVQLRNRGDILIQQGVESSFSL